jgi:hypothetical protein
MALPRCRTAPGTIEGRTGTLLVQGEEFLAECDRDEVPAIRAGETMDIR